MILSQAEIERINAASLRILETVGVKINSPGVIQALRGRGCKDGPDADVLLIPRELVAECLQIAPGEIRLCDPSGGEEVLRPGVSRSLFWTCNALNIFIDGGARPIEEPEFIAWTRLTDSLDCVHAAVAPSIADHPPWSRDFVGFRLLAENTTKHLRPCIYTPDGAVAILEMAEAMLGGASVREKPIVSFGYTVVSPLQWSAPALELFEKTSGFGAPMMINAEPTAGVTSPVTLSGALALANAEALSGVVITQILEPGRPVVFNLGFTHTLDMLAAIARTGGPENALLGSAGAQLATLHGLPSASWASTESMTTDQQAAYEFTTVALMHTLAGVNIIWGIGQLEAQRTISLEQGVIDNEIARIALRIQRGIDASEEAIAEELIVALGHKAEYLGSDHTLDRFRSELLIPDLGYVGRREIWEEAGGASILERARDRVSETLAAPAEPKIPDDVATELRSIEARWMDRLA